MVLFWSSGVRAQSGLRGKRKWPLLMVLFLSPLSLSLLSSSGLFTFLPERGISEQTVQNKSFKVDKVPLIDPNNDLVK